MQSSVQPAIRDGRPLYLMSLSLQHAYELRRKRPKLAGYNGGNGELLVNSSKDQTSVISSSAVVEDGNKR